MVYSYLRFGAAAIALLGLSLPSQALDIKKKDNLVFISGEMDYKDMSPLDDAIAGGDKTLVIGNVRGGWLDLSFRAARLIQKAGVKTVAATQCGGSCAIMYMAGKERFFARPTKANPIYLVITGVRYTNSTDRAIGTELYSYFSDRFSPNTPSELLTKYITKWEQGSGLWILPPEKGAAEGVVLECPEFKNPKTYMEVKGLTTLTMGVITSTTPFELPE